MNLVPTIFIENVASLLGEYYFDRLTLINGHFGRTVARIEIKISYGDSEMSKEMMNRINQLQRHVRHVELMLYYWDPSTMSPSLIDFIQPLRVTEITALDNKASKWDIVKKCVQSCTLERASFEYASSDYCCNDCHSDSEMRRLSAFLNENKEAIRGKMITICDMDESCLENLKKLTSVNIDSEYEEDDGDEFLCAHIYC
ncbi:hypothetical protein QR680_014919 [Steinernema hermaphroditum]|uniref:Uncharacterized protein n=1 Tax=Steinernema hermaphroditum TaxID=289476 RepID=A0AA39M4U9_9BILA|nr:hypothetical protein QR680_014919 [Steinernema hermaphroditum]